LRVKKRKKRRAVASTSGLMIARNNLKRHSEKGKKEKETRRIISEGRGERGDQITRVR